MSPPLYQLSYIAMNAGKIRQRAAEIPAKPAQAGWPGWFFGRQMRRAQSINAAIGGGRDGTRTRNNQIDSLGL